MNSTSILEQFVVKGKGASEQVKIISTILVIITVIALGGLIVYLAASAGAQAVTGPGGFSISQNPELLVAQRYAAEVAARGETLFEIQNPELNLVLRLQEAAASEAEISDYPNPEVVFANRFGPDWIENPELNLVAWYENYLEQVSLYKNPELMVAGRYTGGSQVGAGLTIEQKYAVMGVEAIQPISAYANPELWVANRFTAAAEPVSFAENPELMVAGRFAEGSSPASGLTMEQKYAVMGVEVSQPISFYANPELMMVERFAQGQEASTGLTIEQKYAVMGVEVSHPISIYANPEVHFAQRFAGETGAGSQGWAVNPELALAQPYSTPIYSAEFLAVNPEIKQHLGFIQGG